MRVSDLMRRDPVTVRPQDSLEQLEEVLVRQRITGAPVVSGHQVVGVVSRSDVVARLELERSRFEGASWYLEPFDAEERNQADFAHIREAVAARLGQLVVSDLMSKEVLWVAPGDSLQAAASLMVARRVHRLLVLEEERLVGIVSSLDLLRGVAGGGLALDP
jgi:CBS domain-containing protein